MEKTEFIQKPLLTAFIKNFLFHVLNKILNKRGMKITATIEPPRKDSMTMGLARTRNTGIPISSVIDIGASNGKWALLAMKYFPNANYLLIEPLEEHRIELKLLSENYKRLKYVVAAAGASDGLAKMKVTEDLNGSSVSDSSNEKRRVVKLISIDRETEKNNMNGPYMIKLDTHGYEKPILEGAVQVLKNTNIIVMEVYNFDISSSSLRFYQMCDYLDKLGFRCFDLVEPRWRKKDSVFWQMDLFFCRKSERMFRYNNYE